MQRDRRIDAMRGFAAFLVMWVHIPIVAPQFLVVMISTIMLPVFFAVSGYVLRVEGVSVKAFFKERWSSLFVSWIIISYAESYLNVSDIKRIISNPTVIIDIGKECALKILRGQAIWFIPALLIALLLAFGIIKICGYSIWKSLSASFAIVLISDGIMKRYGVIEFWNISTALTNQFLIVLGYSLKQTDVFKLNKWNRFWIIFHGFIVYLFVELGFQGFDVRHNSYQNVILYLIMSISGIYALITIAHKISKCSLLMFMGRHSLLYFAFGPHGYRIGRIVLELGERIFGYECTGNGIEVFVICIIACVAWVIPALIVDLIFPALNGVFLWPCFSKDKFRENLKRVKNSVQYCLRRE